MNAKKSIKLLSVLMVIAMMLPFMPEVPSAAEVAIGNTMLDARFLEDYGQQVFCIGDEVAVAPTADGTVGEGEYMVKVETTMDEYGKFNAPTGGTWAVEWVNYYLSYDEDCIYIAAEVYDPDHVPFGTYASNYKRADQFCFYLGGMKNMGDPEGIASRIAFRFFDGNLPGSGVEGEDWFECQDNEVDFLGNWVSAHYYDISDVTSGRKVEHDDETNVTTYEVAINWDFIKAVWPHQEGNLQYELLTFGAVVQDSSNEIIPGYDMGHRTGIRNWGITGEVAEEVYATLAEQYASAAFFGEQGEKTIPNMIYFGTRPEYEAFKAECLAYEIETETPEDDSVDYSEYGQKTYEAGKKTATVNGTIGAGEYTNCIATGWIEGASDITDTKLYVSYDDNNLYIGGTVADASTCDCSYAAWEKALFIFVGGDRSDANNAWRIYLCKANVTAVEHWNVVDGSQGNNLWSPLDSQNIDSRKHGMPDKNYKFASAYTDGVYTYELSLDLDEWGITGDELFLAATAFTHDGKADSFGFASDEVGVVALTNGIYPHVLKLVEGDPETDVPETDVPETEPSTHNGVCGDNAYWSFDETTGTLTIFGSGAMTNYEETFDSELGYYLTNSPWYVFRNDISTIIVADGITSVGDLAFWDCWNVSSITLADSIEHIGSNATIGIHASTILLPKNLKTISSWAFQSCGITEIEIPASVTSVGFGAFANCYNLRSISVSAENEIYHSAGNCLIETATETLIATCKNSVIPSDGSVKKIAYGALRSPMQNIVIPASVTSIESYGDDISYETQSLTVAAGNPVYHSAGNCVIHTRSKTLILGCKNSIIPADGSVTVIGENAFWGLQATSIEIPSTITTIGNYAFGASILSTVTIPTSVKYIGDYAFAYCWNLSTINFIGSEEEWNAISKGTGWDMESGDYTLIFHELTNGRLTTVPSCSVNGSMTYDCLTCGGTHERIITAKHEIGEWVFDTVNGGATSECVICGATCYMEGGKCGTNAFWSFDETTGTLTVFGSGAMEDYGWIYDQNTGTSTYHDAPWYEYRNSIRSIKFEGNITRIGADAFYGCTNLASITISEGVTSIGTWAFDSCRSLTTINIPASVTSIRDGAFAYCNNLASITVSDGNTAYHVDSNCLIKTATKTLVAGCYNSVIPDDGSVTIIGVSAFLGCSRLESIEIPDTVTRIEMQAFRNCSSLDKLVIPNNIKYIGYGAFVNVPQVEYCGTEEMWNAVSKETNWDFSMNSTITFHEYSEGTLTKAPTCTVRGETTYNCLTCGEVVVKNNVAALGHAYGEAVVTREADCTTSGQKVKTCTRAGCGATYTETIMALGHTLGEGTVLTEPSCTEFGTTLYVCEVCEEEVIKRSTRRAHTYVDNICSSCGRDKTDIFKEIDNTYNASTSVMPSNWNEFTYYDNNDTQIMSYIGSSFFEYDYKFDENGEIISGAFEVEYSAATKLEDVTSTVDAKWGYTDEQKAEGGYAWKITLRNDLAWENGDPITAADFVYSMQQMLHPDFMNFRANTYYDSLMIKNSKAYFFQNQEGIYETIGSRGYASVREAIDAGETVYANIWNMWGAQGYTDENGNEAPEWVPITDETVWDTPDAWAAGTAVDAISGVDLYTYYGAYLEPGTGYDACVYVENTNRDVAWDSVGIYAIEDENAIVVCLDNQYSFLKEDGSLSVWANYYFNKLPLVHRELYESCKIAPADGATLWTSNYCTSVDTTMSWGPYKLESFDADEGYVLTRNEFWYGYNMPENDGLYETDRIVCILYPYDTINLFNEGRLDEISVSGDYIFDERAYSSSTSTGTYGMQLYSNLDVLRNSGNNNGILAIQEFRHAFNLALDRSDIVSKIWPGSAIPCFGLLNSAYYYDIENSPELEDGGQYRNATIAKEGILRAYGYTQGADGKWSGGDIEGLTTDEAYNALTGYNPVVAKEKMKAAIDILLADPEYYGYDATKNITLVYGSSSDTDKQRFRANYLQEVLDDLTKGTALEDKIDVVFDASAGAQWGEAFRTGATQIGFGYGFSGNAFNPFDIIGAFVNPDDDLNYHMYWDTSAIDMTLTMPEGDYEGAGETITMNVQNWYYCLNGLAETENQPKTYNWGAGYAPVEARLMILSALEEITIKESRSIMLIADSSTYLHSYKIDYISYEEHTFMGFGGIKYMTYNYTDAEWAELNCPEHNFVDGVCTNCGAKDSTILLGDVDGDGDVDTDDAIYLLLHCFYPSDYEITQSGDMDSDGDVDTDDAIYLLLHCFYPEDYPLN